MGWKYAVFFIFCVSLVVCASPDGDKKCEILFEWVTLPFDWDVIGNEDEFKQNGLYIPENCALAGIKVYKNDIYVTVPRWKTGVPSTLNKIVYKDGKPVLSPYPSIEIQSLSNEKGIKYVQSMEIDSHGRMWIIDTGMLNLLEPSSYKWNQPKILVIDLNTDEILKTFWIPEHIAVPGKTFLNDIVVDEKTMVAFISNAQEEGGIFAFDYNSDTIRLWKDKSLNAEVSENNAPGTYTFSVKESGEFPFPAIGIDGISFNPNRRRIFYCPLGGVKLYSINADLLSNFHIADENVADSIIDHGSKFTESDGLACDEHGDVYFGDLRDNAVKVWRPRRSFILKKEEIETVCQDDHGLQWPDTFAFDTTPHLYVVSNKLQEFVGNKMDFSGKSGANFRVWKTNVERRSYIYTGKSGIKDEL